MKISMQLALLSLGAVMITGCATGSGVQYTNGHWYDGKGFKEKVVYVADGKISARRPAQVIGTVDLEGDYIVPAFGDAHVHFLEPDKTQAYVDTFAGQGILYIKDQANIAFITEMMDPVFDAPDSFDILHAQTSFSGVGAHPVQVAYYMLNVGVISERDFSKVLYQVDTIEDLDKVWDEFLALDPDFVKIFLLYSEEFEKRRYDDSYSFHRGINPEVAAEIVRRAHAAGLTVSAHAYSAHDFRTAMDIGVDEITHVPGMGFKDSGLPEDNFRITAEDAKRAAALNIPIQLTLVTFKGSFPQDVVAYNIALFEEAGARLIMGSDHQNYTAIDNAEYILKLGLFGEGKLLHMLSVDTPKAIFPNRDVGGVTPGSEANFVVLEENPLEDFSAIRKVKGVYKHGQKIR